jgi:hypothetical protein
MSVPSVVEHFIFVASVSNVGLLSLCRAVSSELFTSAVGRIVESNVQQVNPVPQVTPLIPAQFCSGTQYEPCGQDNLGNAGVGGIFSAHDAYKKIRAGASLVALITGMIFEGPQLIGEINAGLESYLKRDGFGNIHEAVGVDTHGKEGV